MADSAGESIATPHDFEMAAGRVEIADVPNGVVDGILAGAIRLGTGSNAFGVPDDLLVGAADGSEPLARLDVFRDRSEEWRWRLRHRDGNINASCGEGYTRKQNAQKGLRSAMEISAQPELTETLTN